MLSVFDSIDNFSNVSIHSTSSFHKYNLYELQEDERNPEGELIDIIIENNNAIFGGGIFYDYIRTSTPISNGVVLRNNTSSEYGGAVGFALYQDPVSVSIFRDFYLLLFNISCCSLLYY